MMGLLTADQQTTQVPIAIPFYQAPNEVLEAFQRWRAVCDAFDLVEPEEMVARVKEMNDAKDVLDALLKLHRLAVVNSAGKRVLPEQENAP